MPAEGLALQKAGGRGQEPWSWRNGFREISRRGTALLQYMVTQSEHFADGTLLIENPTNETRP